MRADEGRCDTEPAAKQEGHQGSSVWSDRSPFCCLPELCRPRSTGLLTPVLTSSSRRWFLRTGSPPCVVQEISPWKRNTLFPSSVSVRAQVKSAHGACPWPSRHQLHCKGPHGPIAPTPCPPGPPCPRVEPRCQLVPCIRDRQLTLACFSLAC